MKNLSNKIKIMGMVFGLTALSYMPLKAQEKEMKIKAGLAYSTIKTEEIFEPGSFGIELLVEQDLTEKFSTEFELGLYGIGINHYFKRQMNLGLKYNFINKKDVWKAGVKTAIGTSQEYYAKPNKYGIEEVFGSNSLCFLMGLDIEKKFKNKKGEINFVISRGINNNTWNFGIRRVFSSF